jgi:acetoin utilization deacetylase AcuC-like enzyme
MARSSSFAFCILRVQVFDGAVAAFKPQAMVLCCGADTLGADPLGKFNLSSKAVAAAVRHAAGI